MKKIVLTHFCIPVFLILTQTSCASLFPKAPASDTPTSIVKVQKTQPALPKKTNPIAPKIEATQKKTTPKTLAGKAANLAVKKNETADVPAASPQPGREIAADPSSTLEIFGDSTLRKYSSRATQLGISVQVSPPLTQLENLTKEKLEEFILVIPVEGLKSGSGVLDGHLQEALKAKSFNEIRGVVNSYKSKGKSGNKSENVTASVDLTVAGKTKTVTVDAKVSLEGTHVRIQGEKDLLMTDFDVNPPTLMLGSIKTADKITIRFNFLLGFKKNEDVQAHFNTKGISK